MLTQMPKLAISFIYKYVDDMFLATDENDINRIIKEIYFSLNGMNLKVTNENNDRQVTFLEFTATAKGRSILFTWYRKDYGSDDEEDTLRKAVNLSTHKRSNAIDVFTRVMGKNNYTPDMAKHIITEILEELGPSAGGGANNVNEGSE